MQIRNRVFVVTGAGNGIGREVALQLLTEGAKVAGVDLSQEGLQQTATLAKAGEAFSLHPTDISDRDAVAELPEQIRAAHGQVDGLINVAGVIQKFVKVADLPYSEIDKVINVNLHGVLHTTKAFLPLLTERPEASLVNVASMGAYTPVPGQAVYGASKAAVALLTQALFVELQDSPVAVSLIYPGAIATDIANNSGAAREGVSKENSTAKMTSPSDAAAVIVDAVKKGTFRDTIGKDASMMDKLSRLAPRRAALIIAKKMKDLVK